MRGFETYGYKVELVDLAGLKDLEKDFKEFERKYSEEHVRERGAEDGGFGIPASEEPFDSPFEHELKYACARQASKVASLFRGSLEMLDGKIKAEKQLLESKKENALERIEAVYDAERHAAEDAFGLKEAHKELERHERHYQSVYERYRRIPIAYIPHWMYVLFAVLIFLGEIPLNAMVFQIFGENQVMTWVMAFVVGLAVPISAHFIGIKMREHPDGFSLPNAFKASIGMAIVSGALYWLSSIRQTYLGEHRDELGLTEALVQSSFMFFWLNIAVLAAAIMISYLSHDPVPGYQEAAAALEKAKRKVEKRESKRIVRLKKAAVERAAQKDGAHTEFRENMNRVNLMRGTYDQLLKEGQEYESRCGDFLMQLISTYRHENLRARADKRVPKSFHLEYALDYELAKVKEKLDNESDDIQPPA